MTKGNRPNVIYKMNCIICEKHKVDCRSVYVYMNISVQLNAEIVSHISMHTDKYGHGFDWEDVEILDRRNTKKTRAFLESWDSSNA